MRRTTPSIRTFCTRASTIAGLLACATSFGCERGDDNETERRLAALEARVEDIERRADCPSEMVPVADFCVDRHESSIWSEPNCTGVQYGLAVEDFPKTFPANGAYSEPLYACSLPEVMPSREMTWFQAHAACAASGKRLCTNAEWQLAALGTHDPGAHSGFDDARCNTLNDSPQFDGARETGMAGDTPGGEDGCVSIFGVEDAIGNVWEWTADWTQAGVGWMQEPGLSTDPWPGGFGSDGTWNVNGKTTDNREGRARHEIVWYDGMPAVFIRGGNWENGEMAGSYAVWLGDNPTVANWILGARCCRSRLLP